MLEINATFGTTWKIGDYVRKGQVLGKVPGNNNALISAPQSGIIQAIVFNPENHVLSIELLINEKL